MIEISGIRLQQQEYWQGLKNYMIVNHSSVRLRRAKFRCWDDISLGRSNYYLTITLNSLDNSINIWLTIRGSRAKDDFEELKRIASGNSLSEVNKDLVWDRKEKKLRSVVSLKKNADFTDESDRTNQFEWFKDNLEKFDKYFRPKVKDL